MVNKIFICFMNLITYELKKNYFFSYYFKILYFRLKNNVNDYDFRSFLTNCGFTVIMIKDILPLKWGWIKKNCKTTVINSGFLHLKKKSM